MMHRGIYLKYIKRPMDLVLALSALVVLSPVLLAVAILVRIKFGSPVIFRQQRPGKNEKIFTLYKFRTLTNKKNENGELLPDCDRLTKFGKFLRSTSLDELPELWNIVRGDMSIIGPRPLAVIYLPYYTEKEHHRHHVRPGLTGLAQVNGRNAISWEEKFAYDLDYIQHLSFVKDVRIILQTVKKVSTREGIGQAEKSPVSLHIERQKQEEQRV